MLGRAKLFENAGVGGGVVGQGCGGAGGEQKQ